MQGSAGTQTENGSMLRVAMALGALLGSIALAQAQAATVVPTVYEAGHFIAVPTTKDGQTFRILVDTGGGGGDSIALSREAAARLKLKPSACATPAGQSAEGLEYISQPEYTASGAMPAAKTHCADMLLIEKGIGIAAADGITGGRYLSTRVWTFDYPARQLRVEDGSWRSSRSSHAVDLGMQRNNSGGLGAGYPRVTIAVAGERIDVLLDTGATAQPTKAGLAAMKTPLVRGQGVASYITTSIMDRWHAAHPEWPLVANADDALPGKPPARAIRVPSVEIGGWSVGAVWFTERPDANFESFMSQFMDKTIHGAVGANVLDAFVMTLDYPKAKAWLACPDACRATPVASTAVKH